MKKFILTICIIALIGISVSRAAIVASDDFSYADGNLAGENGGTGFSGSWSAGSGTVNVSSGVTTTANNNANTGFRTFSSNFADTGTLWVSFDWGHTPSLDGNGWGGLTFYIGGTEKLLIGNTYGVKTWGANGPEFSAVQTMEASDAGMKTGVAKIVMGVGATDSIELWVGATGSPVNVSVPAMATAANFDLAGVDNIRILGQRTQSMDNLIIGTSMADVDAIPEPAVLLLSGLGSLLLLRRRR